MNGQLSLGLPLPEDSSSEASLTHVLHKPLSISGHCCSHPHCTDQINMSSVQSQEIEKGSILFCSESQIEEEQGAGNLIGPQHKLERNKHSQHHSQATAVTALITETKLLTRYKLKEEGFVLGHGLSPS